MKVLTYLFLALVLMISFAPMSPVAFACVATDANCLCPPIVGGQAQLPCSPTDASGLLATINKVFTTMFIFLVTAASFFLLYAAFIYVTSEGEQEKVDQAKKIIMYAVVALIVAALALGAPSVIQNFIG